MAPDENEKKDLQLEDVTSDIPEEEGEDVLAAVDPDDGIVDLDAAPEETPDDMAALSAGGADMFEDTEFEDHDLDVDITGDEEIDFADDPDMEKSGGNLKKVIAPALVLVIAAGVGGYIIMNPQILGRGKAVPEPKVTYMAPEPSTFSTTEPKPAPDLSAGKSSIAATNSFGSGDLPQPTATQNEIPRGPHDGAEPAGFAALEPKNAPAIVDVTEDSKQDEAPSAFDLTESAPSAGPAGVSDLSAQMPEPPPLDQADVTEISDSGNPDNAGHSASPQSVKGAGSAKAESASRDVVASAPAPAPEKSAASASFELAEADVSESPAAVPPSMPLSMPKSAAKAAQPAKPAEKPAAPPSMPKGNSAPAAAGQTRSASDTYYDGVIPKGPMAEVGPRKVDPTLEPASQFVVVKRSADASDFEATLVAADRALELKRFDAALDMYNKLYERNSHDPRVLMGRAVAQQNTGLVESAIHTYEELLDIDPKNPDATLNMLGLLRKQYPSVALRRLMNLYDKNPDNAGIAAQIGVTEADLKNYDDAMRYLGIAASLEPNNAQHVFNMAIIADRSGHAPEAVKYYEKALQLDAVYSSGRSIPRDSVYDRLATLRRR